MPHFVIDCSDTVLNIYENKLICEQIHLVALDTGLFVESEIKVRINPFNTYCTGSKDDAFIHVFAHIMQGRTTNQKATLSKQVVTKLTKMFPSIENIAMNVTEFEQASYCNRKMLKVIE